MDGKTSLITSPIPSDISSELEQVMLNAWQDLRGQAKRSPVYKRLTERKYRNPAKFPTWENVALQIAAYREFSRLVPREQFSQDWTMRAAIGLSSMTWQSEEIPPCYWLSQALGEALLATDLPPVSGLRKVVPLGVLMLPPLLRNPDGYLVDWVVVAHFEEGDIQEDRRLDDITIQYEPQKFGGRVAWFHILPNGNAYSQSIGIYADSDDPDFGNLNNPETVSRLEGEEAVFSKKVGNLVLQCLLCLQSRPDLLDEDDPPTLVPGQARPHRKRKQNEPPLLSPRWIGKTFVARSEGNGSHSSPSTHWRRGHWRRVAVGTGRSDRRWTWIEPTLVMGSN